MGHLIYQELGIDHTTMMTDPAGFVKQVFDAAETLKNLLREDTSVSNYVRNAEKHDHDISSIDTWINDFWNHCNDNIPVGALTDVATKLRKLAKDIEYMARDKAIFEMANNSSEISRPLAHELYKLLRKNYHEWIGAMEILEIDVVAPKLAPMPGNYGKPVGLKHYVYMFDGEAEGYRIHLSVLKRLGLDYMNLMDTHEYINAHPELGITITEWTN